MGFGDEVLGEHVDRVVAADGVVEVVAQPFPEPPKLTVTAWAVSGEAKMALMWVTWAAAMSATSAAHWSQ